MPTLIPQPPVQIINDASAILPPFLQLSNKITYKHGGIYYRGYLGQRDGVFYFVFKRHHNCKTKDWSTPLNNLPATWASLVADGTLQPGYVASLFLKDGASVGASDPVANFVSAVDLHCDCPASLLQALADNHLDRKVWLQSYYNEKRSLERLQTYQRLMLGQYCAL